MNEQAAQMWDEYATATGASGEYTAWAFGSGPEMADELARLVVAGPKRATAGLLTEYETEGEPLPQVGDHSIILGGGGEPICIIRTTWVDLCAWGDVDDRFAYDEGEGDRTLAWWKDAHSRFYQRLGHAVNDQSTMVLERFDLVWPTPG